MTPANDTGHEVPPKTQPLAAARSAKTLLEAARDLLLDAEGVAKDGGLTDLAARICRQIDDLEVCLEIHLVRIINALEAEGTR